MEKPRLSTKELMDIIPSWCYTGNLVRVDEDLFDDDEERVGLIIDFWVICVENLSDEQYNELIYHDEWLLIDVSIDNGILHQVFPHNLLPVTLRVKIGETHAQT
jgi:hypothetical protein